MLIPHKPSKALHKPGRARFTAEDLDDVHILEKPNLRRESQSSSTPGQAITSGRTAIWNPTNRRP